MYYKEYRHIGEVDYGGVVFVIREMVFLLTGLRPITPYYTYFNMF